MMIYELRIYHCVTGRLPALLKRFESTTLELWKRHGIRQAGFWTVLVGDGGNRDLHYLLAWESMAERAGECEFARCAVKAACCTRPTGCRRVSHALRNDGVFHTPYGEGQASSSSSLRLAEAMTSCWILGGMKS